MLDSKKIKELENRVKEYIVKGILKSKQEPTEINFFLTNAKNSLTASKLLLDVSTKSELQKATGYLKFNGFLWVINSSYYSMFYIARALLEKKGVKIKKRIF